MPMKKAAALLVSALFLTSIVGCSSSNGNENAGSAAPTQSSDSGSGSTADTGSKSAPTKFSYLKPVWGPATYQKGGAFEKELFEKANVNIDVQIVPVTDYDTKVKTIVASGEIPDVMWGSGPGDAFFRETQEQGAFLKINDYLDKYPAVKEAVPQSIWDMLKDKDGNIYFLPNTVNPDVAFLMYYRKDWFEQLNIPEPKTVDDLVAALQKFKDTPINGQKKIPLTVSDMWTFKDLATSWGASFSGWQPAKDDPNKLVPSYMSPEQKDFYFWVQNLSKNGLVDPDLLVSPNASKSEDKFKAGNVAVLISHYNNYPTIVNDLKKTDPNGEVGIISPLVGPTGIKGGVRAVLPIDRGFYISAKAKDPDGIFRYLNWELTEGHNMMKYGVEGKNYEVKDGKIIPFPEDKIPDDYKRPQMEPFWSLTPFSDSGMVDWNYNKDWMASLGESDLYDYYKSKYEEYSQNEFPDYRNPFIPSQTESEIGSKIYEDNMNSIVSGVVINHKLTPEDWDKHVQDWLKAGGSKIIDEVNANQTDKSKPSYK
ncbi:extracellular solute-binding protein [Paenibacillus protaetiae]|uniref:Extracellular solute-binding protein n=2 Tax=Paenibacillus protaetiae TaxID=2509456 RepID=A0A4P6EXQ5_9BACL|nr:extracellular solute-binding protein [Paenibacillus protaetiae]